MPDLPELAYNADGLVPCIVQDADSREVLMMAWMNEQSLRLTLEQRTTWFWSRSRQELWHKGATSGNTQQACRAALRLRRRHAARARPSGRPRLPHRRAQLLLPRPGLAPRRKRRPPAGDTRLSAGVTDPPAARPSEAGMRPKQAHTLRRHGRRTLRLHYKST